MGTKISTNPWDMETTIDYGYVKIMNMVTHGAYVI